MATKRIKVVEVSKAWGRYRWHLKLEGSPNRMGTYLGTLRTPEGMVYAVCDEMATPYACLRYLRVALSDAMNQGHTFLGKCDNCGGPEHTMDIPCMGVPYGR